MILTKRKKLFASYIAFIFLLTVKSLGSQAQVAELLIDIEPGEKGSGVHVFAVGKSKAFFTANTSLYGNELWCTDGTKDGTRIVIDLVKGPRSAPVYILKVTENGVFFIADDGVTGRELWWSDGTEKGTVLLKDINQGKANSLWSCNQLIQVNNLFYFIADDGQHGAELWKTDGTPEGTALVRDINQGPPGSFKDECTSLYSVGERLVFIMNDGKMGDELWCSDGTYDGTHILKDINSNTTRIDVKTLLEPVDLNNENLIFKVKSIDSGVVGSSLQNFIYFKGRLYFTVDDNTHGRELWRTDGTTEGTTLFKDILPGKGSAKPNQFLIDNNYLFFRADSLETYGSSFFRSDGSPEGTVPIKEFIIGNKHLLEQQDRCRIGDVIFYRQWCQLDSLTEFATIFKSDGTAKGTGKIKDFRDRESYPQGVRFLAAIGELAYFASYTSQYGEELWRTDGTDNGTYMIQDISLDQSSSKPWSLIEVNGHWIFSAEDQQHGRELWLLKF